MLDHTYIDDNSMAERYLRHALAPHERRDFEEHLVDCEECGDRLLLAEMFLIRNGDVRGTYPAPIIVEKPAAEKSAVEKPAAEPEQPLFQQFVREQLPLRARIAARLSPWQLLFLFVLMALILLSIPAVGVYLQDRLHR